MSAPAGWVEYQNSQLIEHGVLKIGDGYRAKRSEMGESGLPFARAANIDSGFDLEDADLLQDESVAQAGDKLSRPGDIVFTSKGTVGRFALVGDDTPHFVYSPQLCFWRVLDRTVISPRYLYYWMQGPDFLGQVNQVKGLTDIADYVSLTDQRAMVVRAPDLPAQIAISKALGVYDDLINNNRRRIEILEQKAQAIYREWFVNFRFPGHEDVGMVESELGLIPEGWAAVPFSEAVEINPRLSFDKEVERPYVPMGAVSETSMIFDASDRRKGRGGARFQNGDTLFARINPSLQNGKTGFVQFLPSDSDVAIGSTEFIVFRSRSLCPELVQLASRSPEVRGLAIKSMVGASGRQRVQLEIFDSLLIPQPPKDLVSRSREVLAPMFELAWSLAKQNAVLRETRDLLLPRLVSGEISVEDVPVPDDSVA